jgi:hypothetical protein
MDHSFRYHDQLKNRLKLRNSGDLAYCEEKDLSAIGMSRPEQKRLRHEFQKHFPSSNQPSTSNSLANKIKKKVFGEPNNSQPNDGGVGHTSPTNGQQQHIIAAENISLCKELGKGEFGCVYQAAWHISSEGDVENVMQVRYL